jgi:hypothetical protein
VKQTWLGPDQVTFRPGARHGPASFSLFLPACATLGLFYFYSQPLSGVTNHVEFIILSADYDQPTFHFQQLLSAHSSFFLRRTRCNTQTNILALFFASNLSICITPTCIKAMDVWLFILCVKE